MKSVRDLPVKNKRVLLRVDFNVPLKNGQLVDDFRIRATLPTINYLLSQSAQLIILTHLGRPSQKDSQYSLRPVAEHLAGLLNQPVSLIDLGHSKKPQPGQVVFLENLRFYPGETKNDPGFVQRLAQLGDFYINDAFGTIHRPHASIIGLPRYLPSGAGLLLEKEIRILDQARSQPDHPLVVVIGGVKISTKLKLIEKFLNMAENIILGGALANTVIRAKGFAVGQSIVEETMVKEVQKLELTDTRLHLPLDVVVSKEPTGRTPKQIAPVGKIEPEEMILDIGPDSCLLFKEIISQAKMIIWNGPMGLYEVEAFAQGTEAVARAVADSEAFSIVGGGDSIGVLKKLSLIDKISHVSTGGGAMLKFLAGEQLIGLEALENEMVN